MNLDEQIKVWMDKVYGQEFCGRRELQDAAALAVLAVVNVHRIGFQGTPEHGYESCVVCGGERGEPNYCETLAEIARVFDILAASS